MAEHRAWLTDLDRAIGDADHGENMHRGFTAVLARLDAGAALGPAGVPDSVAAVLQLVAMTLMSSVGGAAGPLYGTAYLRAGQRCAALVAESASDTVGDAVGDAGGDAVGETVGGTAGDAGDTVGGTVGDAADTVGGAVGDAADTVGGTVGDAADHRDVPGPPGELGAREVVGLLEAALGGIVARGKATPGEKTMVDAWTPALHAARAAEQDGADATGTLRAAADAAQAGAAATEPLVATKGRASYLGERSVGHRDPGAASSALILRAAAECAADPAVGAPLGTP